MKEMDKTDITFGKDEVLQGSPTSRKMLPHSKLKKLPGSKEEERERLQQMSSIMTMQTPTYDRKNALSQSVDVTSMREYLSLQRNRFTDLFTFGDKDQPEKVPSSRVKNNVQLNQIYEKLRDPSLNQNLLEKSLLIRDPEAEIYHKKKLIDQCKVKTQDLYDQIRKKKTMPSVPLHRMDEISRNLAESLLNRTADEPVPQKEWKQMEVMLPILNAANRSSTLHSTHALCSDDIQKHKKIKPNLQKLAMKQQLRKQRE